MFDRGKQLYRKHLADSKMVADECLELNLRRVHYASLVGVIISIIHLSLFLFSPIRSTALLEMWRMGIIICHSVLLILMLAVRIISSHWRKTNQKRSSLQLLQYIVIGIIMLGGVVIVSVDQLATSNITPYIVVCMILGTVFLINPSVSFIIYASSYLLYYFAISTAPQPVQQLLSNRVNGISAIGLGYGLSVILWRLNIRNVKQKRRIIEQQQQLEHANRELEQMAYFDALTGLPNRRHFDEVLKKELALIERKGYESCLVMLDVDGFKCINDVYGHPAGDNLLVQLSQLLSRSIRKYDTLCRLGGDEFIILLPQTSLTEAMAFAERFRKRLAPCSFQFDSLSIRATASLGVARLTGSRYDTLIKQYGDVDKALYLAKEQGRNCVRCAS